ncbi:hypothetical protein HY493_05855 [Candidatus Woesearchaeota archaeon]|nr:hypothetical protein [Candidatus Woesearchaeota archaeon]
MIKYLNIFTQRGVMDCFATLTDIRADTQRLRQGLALAKGNGAKIAFGLGEHSTPAYTLEERVALANATRLINKKDLKARAEAVFRLRKSDVPALREAAELYARLVASLERNKPGWGAISNRIKENLQAIEAVARAFDAEGITYRLLADTRFAGALGERLADWKENYAGSIRLGAVGLAPELGIFPVVDAPEEYLVASPAPAPQTLIDYIRKVDIMLMNKLPEQGAEFLELAGKIIILPGDEARAFYQGTSLYLFESPDLVSLYSMDEHQLVRTSFYYFMDVPVARDMVDLQQRCITHDDATTDPGKYAPKLTQETAVALIDSYGREIQRMLIELDLAGLQPGDRKGLPPKIPELREAIIKSTFGHLQKIQAGEELVASLRGELSDSVGKARKEADRFKETYGELESRFGSLQSQSDDYKRQLEVVKREKTALESLLAKKDEDIIELETNAKAVYAQAERVSEESRRSLETIAGYERKLQVLLHDKTVLESASASDKRNIILLGSRIEQMRRLWIYEVEQRTCASTPLGRAAESPSDT